MRNKMFDSVIKFLNSIGIKIKKGRVPKNAFLENLVIKKGTIIYNDKALIEDILHEAGHIAIIPQKYRHFCDMDMDTSIEEISSVASVAGEMEADNPICRAIINASEAEAIAWSWAAGKHIGLPEEEIIMDLPLDLYGKVEKIRYALKNKCHPGINGLRAAGMLKEVKEFPILTYWVQT